MRSSTLHSNGQTILLVDDDQDILDFISYNLSKEGYKVFTADNGSDGVKMAKKISPSLVLLDLMMPMMDGIEACQKIREDISISQPIIAFLTSRGEDYSQVAGFEAGADDYITKPVRPRLLVSKIESLIRRIDRNDDRRKLTTSDSSIIIDRERYLVTVEGKEIYLPKKEFELLEMLANKPGKVFNREQILLTVWGNETIVGERTIDVHIRKLREKLGVDYIRTIKGVGYTFTDI